MKIKQPAQNRSEKTNSHFWTKILSGFHDLPAGTRFLEISFWMKISLIAYFSFFVLGALSAWSRPAGTALIVENLRLSLSFLKNIGSFEIFLFIFFNNALKSFLAMISGIFLGFVPILFLAVNGFILGLVSMVKITAGEGKTLLALIPHGLFELTALFLACGWGLRLGYGFYRFLLFRDPLKPVFLKAVKKFFQIAVPLYLLAAFAEVFISARLIKLLAV